MLTEREQQGATKMLNQSRVQVRVKKGWRVSIERQMRTAAMTVPPWRPSNRQDNVDAIEWLFTSILHDLRNPLGAIYAAAEMLIDLDPGPTQVQRLATNIFRAAGRMRELLADLNGVADGKRTTAEMCDIREVISAASNAASAAAQNGRVQIVLEVPEGIKLSLLRTRIQSVFFNLIANALEAMPSGGTLHMGARETGGCVLIEIEDTGPGIPHEIRDRLFEPFVTAGKPGGLGLGLALSRQSVLDHGGDMWIEPAAGARFVIRFPLNGGEGS
jgi:signal transduction histidine kinase